MKKKIIRSSISTILFMSIFLFAFQQSAEAQFRIWNNTSCTVNFKVGQRGAAAICSVCNPSGVISLLPGAIYVHPALATCGPEYWFAFKYFIGNPTSPIGSSGVSYNPGLAGGCGADLIGLCNNNPITATWFSAAATGAGPTTVILN